MNRVVLQIPIDVSLRKAAEKSALEQGFSSLQEAVRVIIKRLADKKLTVAFEDTIALSPKAIARYNRIDKDLKNGKNIYKAKDVKDLMKHLRENSIS